MAEAATAVRLRSRKQQHLSRLVLYKRLLWVVTVVGALAAVYIALIAMNWPFTQQGLIDVLQERSLRTVTIGHFYRTFFPPGCTAEDIRFLRLKHKDKPPPISIRKLVLVTSYSRILLLQERLSLARVIDMHVMVPPTQPGERNPVMPLTSNQAKPFIEIDKLIADGAILDFITETGQTRYRLLIDKLRLDGVGNNRPMFYKTLISNQMPPGVIRSTGVFGVWNPSDPGSTPLHGSYTFENANLAAFGGISGTLSASGSFKGVLRAVGVQGTADVPNFKVYDTSHERQLAVSYQAVVDGTTGDTKLEQVSARFDHTTVGFKGSIAGIKNAAGKAASLDMWTSNGRVEDILNLFTSDKTPAMTGMFTFAGHVDLPPAPNSFLRRVRLTGDFGVDGGKFANRETERDLTRLSDSSRKPTDATSGHGLPANVLSDLKGHGAAVNGVATVSNLSFTIPGAHARMHGSYGLLDYKVDLHGTLLTTGSPSDATTGFKSLMLKVATPFLKRKHSEKLVPFKITGSYSKPDVSLDLDRGK